MFNLDLLIFAWSLIGLAVELWRNDVDEVVFIVGVLRVEQLTRLHIGLQHVVLELLLVVYLDLAAFGSLDQQENVLTLILVLQLLLFIHIDDVLF